MYALVREPPLGEWRVTSPVEPASRERLARDPPQFPQSRTRRQQQHDPRVHPWRIPNANAGH